MTAATTPNSTLVLTLLTIGEFEEGWHFYDTRLRLPRQGPLTLRNTNVGRQA